MGLASPKWCLVLLAAGLLVLPLPATAGGPPGSVIAWGCSGENDWGQCTVPAAAASGVTAISAGEFHSLAVKNGGVIAWGCKGESLGDPTDVGQCTVPSAARSGVTAV